MKIICIVKKKLSLYFIFASSFMFWKSSIENVAFEKLLRTPLIAKNTLLQNFNEV